VFDHFAPTAVTVVALTVTWSPVTLNKLFASWSNGGIEGDSAFHVLISSMLVLAQDRCALWILRLISPDDGIIGPHELILFCLALLVVCSNALCAKRSPTLTRLLVLSVPLWLNGEFVIRSIATAPVRRHPTPDTCNDAVVNGVCIPSVAMPIGMTSRAHGATELGFAA